MDRTFKAEETRSSKFWKVAKIGRGWANEMSDYVPRLEMMLNLTIRVKAVTIEKHSDFFHFFLFFQICQYKDTYHPFVR